MLMCGKGKICGEEKKIKEKNNDSEI